jgi:hypothetical protein
MNEQLLSRLDALAEIDAGIRGKLDGPDGECLDGLALARLLCALDASVKRLEKLAEALQKGGSDGQTN